MPSWQNDPYFGGQAAPKAAARPAASWQSDPYFGGKPSAPTKPAPAKVAPDNVTNLLQAVLPGSLAKTADQGSPGDFLRSMQHNLMNLPHGAAQLIENGVARAADMIDPNYRGNSLSSLVTGQPQRSSWNKAIQNVVSGDNTAMAQREQQYQSTVPTNGASIAGAVAGNLLPFAGATGLANGLKSAGGAVGKTVARVPVAGKLAAPVADAATQGAIAGALSPVTSGDDYWGNKALQTGVGTVVGGGVGAATSLASSAWNAVRPVLNPRGTASDTFARIMTGDDIGKAADVAQVLRSSGGLLGDGAAESASSASPTGLLGQPYELVPGSKPTLAEIAKDPRIVAMQKVLGNRPELGELFQQRLIDNNAARWNVINGIAGDDQAMQAAIEARRAAAQPQIDSLLTNGNPINTGGVLDAIKATQQSALGTDPVIDKTLGYLGKTIKARSMPSPDAAPAILDAQGNPLTPTQPAPSMIMPDQLDGLRQNLRGIIADNASNGAVASRQEAGLVPIKSAITDAIEGGNPGYRDYLATYAQNSVPINTMETAGSIIDDLGDRALNAGHDPLLTLTGYRKSLKSALGNAEYGIDPQAEAALNAIKADLQRQSIINSQASAYGGGSATAPNLFSDDWLGQRLYGGGSIGDKAAEQLPYGLGAAVKVWNNLSTQRAANSLADMFLNPTTSGADALTRYANQSDPMISGLFDRLPILPSTFTGLLGNQ